jgi:hypothetical protein
MPRIPAFRRSALSVRFIFLAISGRGVRAFECALSSRTSSLVHGVRWAEVRAYLQTEKYVTRKSDGTLPETTRRILRERAEDNRLRRERLTTLVGELLPAAEFFVAGQALKLKASTPLGALDESMEYLVQNTFNKMGYLKHLCSEPLKETQAILRLNDVGQEGLLTQLAQFGGGFRNFAQGGVSEIK